MKILKAVKDLYYEGQMIRIGEVYHVEEHVASRHIRTGKAVEHFSVPVSKAQTRKTKVAKPTSTKR